MPSASANLIAISTQGVSNAQLVKEKASIAIAYDNKTVAEQNSVDIAWSLLMDDNYKDLRRAIYTTESEYRRFRSLVVNAVMATDIMDKDLGAARKGRWNKAFTAVESPDPSTVNRKGESSKNKLIRYSVIATQLFIL